MIRSQYKENILNQWGQSRWFLFRLST
jgi:hypothetical protein